MSGIAGLLTFDGSPVDGRLLTRLTGTMAFRGPDGLGTWSGGRIGFGHAMLRTTSESQHERQPSSLDGKVWIVADARIDGQIELRRKLRSNGQNCRQSVTDSELILHAYHVWGDECVRHLIGDFAFAIWDGRNKRLFCARDHFGVKPFFYARTGNCLVFSNTLDCVREHPGVSDMVNDRVIADFLLSGLNYDETSTGFADIARLAPAHYLICCETTLRANRYWHLPTDGHLRYRRARDYVEHFSEHLNAAVEDRLRNSHIGILMSGGLDSTSVAATAKSILSNQGQAHDLRAYAGVYDRLVVDEERHYSRSVADALGIPIHYLAADDYALFEGQGGPEFLHSEPGIDPLAMLYFDLITRAQQNCRVVLTGIDGDALLSEDVNSCGGLLSKSMNIARRGARLGWRALLRGRLPKLDLRARLARRLKDPKGEELVCPRWIKSELAARIDLPARGQAVHRPGSPRGCRHKGAYRILTSPLLSGILESYDPGEVRVPVEARHPLLDLRVVQYVLSLPPSPWCIDKKLLRMAMRDRLPESARLRPKAPLACDPVMELLHRDGAHRVDAFEAVPALGKYVDRSAVSSVAGMRDPEQVWTELRPFCLNLWLRRLTDPGQAAQPEECYEAS